MVKLHNLVFSSLTWRRNMYEFVCLLPSSAMALSPDDSSGERFINGFKLAEKYYDICIKLKLLWTCFKEAIQTSERVG